MTSLNPCIPICISSKAYQYIQVAVILPWNRGVIHIAWRWATAILAGSAVITKVYIYSLFAITSNLDRATISSQHLNNFQLLGGEAVRTRELGGSQDGSAFSRSRLPSWLGLKPHQLICSKINHVQQYSKLGNLKSVIYLRLKR